MVSQYTPTSEYTHSQQSQQQKRHIENWSPFLLSIRNSVLKTETIGCWKYKAHFAVYTFLLFLFLKKKCVFLSFWCAVLHGCCCCCCRRQSCRCCCCWCRSHKFMYLFELTYIYVYEERIFPVCTYIGSDDDDEYYYYEIRKPHIKKHPYSLPYACAHLWKCKQQHLLVHTKFRVHSSALFITRSRKKTIYLLFASCSRFRVYFSFSKMKFLWLNSIFFKRKYAKTRIFHSRQWICEKNDGNERWWRMIKICNAIFVFK